MRRDTTTVQEFLLECFLYQGYVKNVLDGKKIENLIGWNRNVLGGKIPKN